MDMYDLSSKAWGEGVETCHVFDKALEPDPTRERSTQWLVTNPDRGEGSGSGNSWAKPSGIKTNPLTGGLIAQKREYWLENHPWLVGNGKRMSPRGADLKADL